MTLPGLDALRTAAWFNPQRARAYLALVALTMLVLACAVVVRVGGSAWHDPLGRPVIGDFDAFWSAARLALSGHAALVYDRTAIGAAEAVGVQSPGGQYLPYFYPPVFTLLCLPFGLPGYLPALAIFSLGGAAAAAFALRRILPAAFPTLAIVAFPGLVMNAAIGQNGFVSALSFSGALVWLECRPALAGACLGVLVYRPQLAVCVPVALLAARRWRALLSCAATAVALILASAAVLGTASWTAFAAALPAISRVPQMADIQPKLLSMFAAVRLLHGPAPLAAAAQAATALTVLTVLARVASRRPGAGPEVACLVAAALLCTPYLLDYDLVCLGVPLAWMAGQGALGGFRPWEKLTLATLFILPLVARSLNITVGLPLTPLLLTALLAICARRALIRPMPVPA
jgi:hypothetical protein